MSTNNPPMNQPVPQPARQSRAARFGGLTSVKPSATVSHATPSVPSDQTLERTSSLHSGGAARMNEFDCQGKAHSVSSLSLVPPSSAVETVWLDPTHIRASRFANRHNWDEKAFLSLSHDIHATRGNVVPIKVRALEHRDADGHAYEIVYGHRRHRACLENELPVLALVVAMDDRQLFLEMLKENETREALSTYDKALMLQKSMQAQLFRTQAELAKSVGMQASVLSRYIRLAELPKELVKAFKSPRDIRINWVAALADAYDRDSATVLEKARAFGSSHEPRDARSVYSALIGQTRPATAKIMYREGECGSWIESGQALMLKLDLRRAPPGWREALRGALSKELGAEFMDPPCGVTEPRSPRAANDTVLPQNL